MAKLEDQPATVRVNMNAILDGVHSRYGQQLANLVQENSETAAAMAQLSDQLAEANQKVAVLDGMRQDAGQREDELEQIIKNKDQQIADLTAQLTRLGVTETLP